MTTTVTEGIRYSIWAAVSTEAQADKVSLSEQVSLCRARAEGKGWQESAGPYIVPGESRSRWVNLRDAEQSIAPLKMLMDDAHDGKYQLLVLYDYNRLRDLIDPVAKTLAAYGVQVYSISQPVEPLPPSEYTPYTSDAESIMRGMAQIMSRAQISDMRRKYAYSMPRRILSGLPQITPYGYTSLSARAPATIDPAQAEGLRLAKDMILSGKSLREAVAALTEHGYAPPRRSTWHPRVLQTMLSNPYYAGVVQWRSTQTVNDPRTGEKRLISTPDRIITAQGQHPPLWTMDEHRALLNALRRRKAWHGRKTNLFSGLLVCGSCGNRMSLDGYKYRGRKLERVHCRCRSRLPTCAKIRYMELLEKFCGQLLAAIRTEQQAPAQAADDTAAKLAAAQTRADRLTDAYLAGVLQLDEFATRKAEIEMEIETLTAIQKQASAADAEAMRRQELVQYILSQADDLPAALFSADPPQANLLLVEIVREITVSPAGAVSVALL